MPTFKIANHILHNCTSFACSLFVTLMLNLQRFAGQHKLALPVLEMAITCIRFSVTCANRKIIYLVARTTAILSVRSDAKRSRRFRQHPERKRKFEIWRRNHCRRWSISSLKQTVWTFPLSNNCKRLPGDPFQQTFVVFEFAFAFMRSAQWIADWIRWYRGTIAVAAWPIVLDGYWLTYIYLTLI